MYIAEYRDTIDTSRAREAYVLFSIGSTISISIIDVEALFGYIIFYIMKIFPPTPFLMTLDDMDKHRIYFNNIIITLFIVIREYRELSISIDTSL